MANDAGLSRRRALQMLGALSAAGFAGAAGMYGCKQQDPEPTPEPTPQGVELQVYDPTGSVEIKYTFAPRIDGFDNKTIAFVSDDSWEIERMTPIIKEHLTTHYQNVTIIGEENFIHGIDAITKANNGIAPQMVEMGVDAAIVGNAG